MSAVQMNPARARRARVERRTDVALDQRSTSRRSTLAVPLIDRESEREVLHAALADARAGCGRIVLLAGEPGIGKTRLAGALADDAEAAHVPVWWGRGWEDGAAPAFWPWNTALRRWIDRAGPDAATSAAGPWRAELAHVFPVLRDRIAALPAPAGHDPAGAQFRLFDLVSRFVAAVAAPAGLVVVLDDLHWADRPSLKLLEFLAAGVSDMRVLLVATFRDTEVEREHPLFDTLSRIAREPSTRRLALAGLTPEHCAQWVAATGADADPATLGAALHRETGGNPFLIGEIVHLLASDGGLRDLASPTADVFARDARRVPHGVREVLTRRVERLGDACRTTLSVAALFTDAIDATILGEVVEAGVLDQLERAVHDRILVEVTGRPGRYTFAHALLRRVLGDALAASARATWHERIASVLESHAAAADVVPTELVHHFTAAGTSHALRRAFEHARHGAEQATRELDWEDAVALYGIALDVGARAGALGADETLELELALARALRSAGEVPAARARCAAVMTACRRTPRPVLLARAALLHVGPMPEFGRVDPAERAVLEEAFRGADALDDGLRARLHARLAGDLIAANEKEQAARIVMLCDEAALAARRAGDEGALAMALLGSYYAAALRLRPRPVEGGVALPPAPSESAILAAAEAGGEHEIAASIRHLRAMGCFAAGAADAFAAEVDGLATAAAASHAPQALWLAETLVALRATTEGRFDDGEAAMDRALATGRRMQLPNASGQHVSQRIMSLLLRGRIGKIAGELDAFVDAHPGGTGWEPVRALAHLAQGDTARARTELRTLLATGLGAADCGVMSRCHLAGLALLCAELGDRASAPVLYERIARRRESWSVDGSQTLGPWQLLLGMLAPLCDRAADAVGHLEQAVQASRRMRARPFIAQAQALLVEARLALDPNAADEQLLAVLDEAEHGAAELDLRHVAARVARLRAMLAGRRATPACALAREGDVWTISFAGRTVSVKDGKGPRYLATLLAAPGRDVHVLELAGGGSTPLAGAPSDHLALRSVGGSIDDAPDAHAKRAYRARLDDLRAELEEAEGRCDRGRTELLRGELDLLVAQLARCFGSHVRRRGPAETARKAVTKVLRTSIGRLLDLHPALGEHLRDSVRMGTHCSYGPRTPTSWSIVAPVATPPHRGRDGVRHASRAA